MIEKSNSNRLLSLITAFMFALLHNHAAASETIPVRMQTSAGDITIELYPEAAPVTVANFLKYVDAHLYDNNANFYRTVRMDNQVQNNIKIEVIQGGIGSQESGLSLTPIAHETSKLSGILHKDGVISMARMEPGSASSEFFICINDQPELDYGGQRNPDGQGFAGFGKVVAGMDVVRRIQNMKTNMPEGQELEHTSGQMLIEPVVIKKIIRIPSQKIDRDTWSVISQAVMNADIKSMASTYHPDAVVISNGDVTPIGDALESWAEGMKQAAADGSSARVSFRFASRQDNERSAFEIGIFKYTRVDSSGTETQMFMHFESVLVKKEGRWLFLLERQFDEANEAAWEALRN